MRKFILFFIVTVLYSNIFSQKTLSNSEITAVEKSILSIQTGYFGVWVNHELKIYKQLVLKSEGIARELVNRVQNLRKEKGLEVTDKIYLVLETNELIKEAIERNKRYIAEEVLASDISFKALNG